MMFQATLDSVAFQLSDARQTADYATGQLSLITGLTWQSRTGRAFVQQVEQLRGRLQALSAVLDDAEHYLRAARAELDGLEKQIDGQRRAG